MGVGKVKRHPEKTGRFEKPDLLRDDSCADGKYLFFSRKFDIYWVDAGIIEKLRPKKLTIKQGDKP